MTFASPPETIKDPDQALPHATVIGDFIRIRRMSSMAPHDEWMATLPDATEVVVDDDEEGRPDAADIEKAISVVQCRAYLGKRAVQLIAPFLPGDGKWRLLTIDFGAEARRYESEFLMCFAFVPVNSTLSRASPYFEVGFSLATGARAEDAPTFNVTVKAIVGIPFPLP